MNNRQTTINIMPLSLIVGSGDITINLYLTKLLKMPHKGMVVSRCKLSNRTVDQ